MPVSPDPGSTREDNDLEPLGPDINPSPTDQPSAACTLIPGPPDRLRMRLRSDPAAFQTAVMNRLPLQLAVGLAVLAPIPASMVAGITAGAVGIAAAAASLAIAIAAALMLRRDPPPRRGPVAARSPALATQAPPAEDASLKRLRHDLRGALSPALLATDRLLDSPDPLIQRSGTVIAESIERAITLIGATRI